MAKLISVTSLTKIGLALIVLSIAVATSGYASAATILLQDNFDSENSENGGGRVLNYDNFANWNVRDGSVDLIAENQFLSGDGLLVDLDGTTYDAGVLESKTTFTFNPGDTVNLSFKLAGDHRVEDPSANSAIVSLGSLFNETFTLPKFQDLTTYTRSFTVTEATSAKLSFEGTGGDNIGLLLDDVELSVTPAAVPDPSTTLGLLTVGAFGVVLRKKYQRQRNSKGTV